MTKSSRISLKLYLLIFSCFCFSLQGQDRSDEFKLKRADALFKQREFEKSVNLYRDLYAKNSSNQIYYSKYLENLIQLKKYADAVKIVEFKLLREPNDALTLNELAKLYYKKQNKEKAFEIWDGLFNGPALKIHHYSQIASTLISERLFEKAILCYETAQLKLNNKSLFLHTIARLYAFGFNYKKAFETHLKNLSLNPRFLNSTQRQIIQLIERPEAMKSILENISMIDSKNVNHLQIEVAIYMKAKLFQKAIKILTKDIFAESTTLITFANEARKLQQYNLAEEAYDYVLNNYSAKYHYSAYSGLLQTRIEKSKQVNQLQKDSIFQGIDDLFHSSEFNKVVSIELLYYSHILIDRFESNKVIPVLSRMVKTYKLKGNELNRANNILAMAYFYNKDFKNSETYFKRVPEDYNNGQKFLYLSAIEMLRENKNINNLNNIISQKDGLSNVYLNDEIKILLLLNNTLKDKEDIANYSQMFYHFIIQKYDLAVDYINKIKRDDKFELDKDRIKYELFTKSMKTDSLDNLYLKYDSEPEWQLKKAHYLIADEKLDEAIAVLNNLIIKTPQHYFAIEARRLLREL